MPVRGESAASTTTPRTFSSSSSSSSSSPAPAPLPPPTLRQSDSFVPLDPHLLPPAETAMSPPQSASTLDDAESRTTAARSASPVAPLPAVRSPRGLPASQQEEDDDEDDNRRAPILSEGRSRDDEGAAEAVAPDRWPHVRSALVCPLCPGSSSALSHPHTLPCGHTICSSHRPSTSSPSSPASRRCPVPFCAWNTTAAASAPDDPAVVWKSDVTVGKLVDLVDAHDRSRISRRRRAGGPGEASGTDEEEGGALSESGSGDLYFTSDEGPHDPEEERDSPSPDSVMGGLATASVSAPPPPSSARPDLVHSLSTSPQLYRRSSKRNRPSPTSSIDSEDAHVDRRPAPPSSAPPSAASSTHDIVAALRRAEGRVPSPPPERRERNPGRKGKAREAAATMEGWRDSAESMDKELASLVDCDVCAMLLFEPVTTPCGHTFCRKCLSRSLDHSVKCPLCRSDLPSSNAQGMACNKVIQSVLVTAFPVEYEERRIGIEQSERDARMDTPLFVCTLAFPFMPTILHVFEPRYRLMLRRCIESSSPRFGMVLPARGGGTVDYGTMLEIRSVQMLNDGRSMIETVGSWRFKIIEKGRLDGYTVGRVERIDDISFEDEMEMERNAVARGLSRGEDVGPSQAQGPISDGPISTAPGPSFTLPSEPSARTSRSSSPSARLPPGPAVYPSTSQPLPGPSPPISPSSLLPPTAPAPSAPPPAAPEPPQATSNPADLSTVQLVAICQSFIDQLRSGSAPWLLQRLNNTYGPMPSDPSVCGYWMASVIPIDEYEKAKLLAIRSPRLRLALIVHWVEQLRSSWWFSSGCTSF